MTRARFATRAGRLFRLFCELLATRDMGHVARRRHLKDEIA